MTSLETTLSRTTSG